MIMCIFLFSLISKGQQHFAPLDSLNIVNTQNEPVFFMTGELHGYSSNTAVEAKFISYLSQNQYMRTILREEGYGYTYLLRKYIATSDTSFLNLFISDFPFNTCETKRFINKLKQINDSLPVNDKFIIIPIDVTENDRLPYAKSFFNLIIKWEVANQTLKREFDSLIGCKSFPNNMSDIKQSLLNYRCGFDYTFELDSIVNSYIIWQKMKKTVYKQRQYYLYENILKVQSNFKGNVYINFGNSHTFIRPKHTAYYLKNDPNFRYRLLIANPYYFNCINRYSNTHRQYSTKSEGYFHKRYFNRNIKLAKLQRGIYLTKVNEETYIIHVNQPELE